MMGVVLSVFLLLPPLETLTSMGMKVVGIFLFTIIGWVFVGIGYPSLLCIALFVVTGVMTPSQAFMASWGNWIVLFMIGCFGLSETLSITGFSRRFAFWFMNLPFTRGRPWMLMAMFLLSCTLLGCVMSAVVTTIVFMSIAGPMLETFGYKKGDPFASMFMMGIAWAATASFGMTPIAHAGNIMVMEWIKRDLDYSISFGGWMLFGIPLGLLVFLILMLFFRYIVRPDVSKIIGMTHAYVRETVSKIGSMQLSEKLALVVFSGVLICWLMPNITSNIAPEVSAYFTKMGYAIPALVGASVLCLIRVKGQSVLTFKHWMTDGVEWGTISLVAAIMILGNVIGNPETGISQLLTSIFKPVAEGAPFNIFLMITLLWVVLQTNIMSNLVSMTMVYTMMVPIAISTGLGNPIALGATISITSNYAFSLPSATASTAVVIGSGWVPVKFMFRYGVMLIIPIVLFFTFVGYPLACLLFN